MLLYFYLFKGDDNPVLHKDKYNSLIPLSILFLL